MMGENLILVVITMLTFSAHVYAQKKENLKPINVEYDKQSTQQTGITRLFICACQGAVDADVERVKSLASDW